MWVTSLTYFCYHGKSEHTPGLSYSPRQRLPRLKLLCRFTTATLSPLDTIGLDSRARRLGSHYVLLLVKANLDFNKYHHHSTFYYYHWLYSFLTCRTDSIFKKLHSKSKISIQNHSSPFFLIRSFSFLSKNNCPPLFPNCERHFQHPWSKQKV